jgi:hypothetical protein
MPGMRKTLQDILNPDHLHAYGESPDVDNDVYLQIFFELRTAFGGSHDY